MAPKRSSAALSPKKCISVTPKVHFNCYFTPVPTRTAARGQWQRGQRFPFPVLPPPFFFFVFNLTLPFPEPPTEGPDPSQPPTPLRCVSGQKKTDFRPPNNKMGHLHALPPTPPAWQSAGNGVLNPQKVPKGLHPRPLSFLPPLTPPALLSFPFKTPKPDRKSCPRSPSVHISPF